MATGNSDGPIKLSKRIEKELHQTKVVMRKLPPDFTEEKLLEMLGDIPPHNYFYFAAGDPTLGALSFSRAYFSFTEEASILPFRDKHDGLYLESESGAKYRAVVEFAPYQGAPKRLKRKPDVRMATIEQDSDYQSFLESLEKKMKPPPTMAEIAAYVDTIGTNKVGGVQKTPLVEYLMERKSNRSGKRLRSAANDKKRGKESSASSRGGKDSRKDGGSSRGGKESSRSKKDSPRESREEKAKKEEPASPAKGSSDDKAAASSVEKQRERSSRDSKRSSHGHHHEENGEGSVKTERDHRSSKVKNRDRPDQAIYTPRGGSSGKHRGERGGGGGDRGYEGKESSGRKDGRSGARDHDHKWSGGGGGGGGREYGGEEKSRRGYGGRERGGRRGDEYRKSRDSYSQESPKTYSSGYREK